MKIVKSYLLNRAESMSAWIGALGFVLEIFLHPGNHSSLMLILFTLLLVLPEEKVKEVFADLTKKIKDAEAEEKK